MRNTFLAAVIERVEAERLANLDARAKAPVERLLPPAPAWHAKGKELRLRGLSHSQVARVCGVTAAAVALMLKRERERAAK